MIPSSDVSDSRHSVMTSESSNRFLKPGFSGDPSKKTISFLNIKLITPRSTNLFSVIFSMRSPNFSYFEMFISNESVTEDSNISFRLYYTMKTLESIRIFTYLFLITIGIMNIEFDFQNVRHD